MQKKILSNVIIGIVLSCMVFSGLAAIKLTLEDIKGISNQELCALVKNKTLDQAALDLIHSELYSRNIKCENDNVNKILAADKPVQHDKDLGKNNKKIEKVDKTDHAVEHKKDSADQDVLDLEEEITEEDVAIANSVNSPKCQKIPKDSVEYVKCNLEELNNSEPEEKE